MFVPCSHIAERFPKMTSQVSPEDLKRAADTALEAGDHMTAMNLFGEAAERAWEAGSIEFARQCAHRVNDVIAQIAEIEQENLPEYIAKRR